MTSTILIFSHNRIREGHNFGGTELLLEKSVEGLIKKGWTVYLSTPSVKNKFSFEISKNQKPFMSYKILELSEGQNPRAEDDQTISKIIGLIQPQIVHMFHHLHQPTNILPIAKAMGIPTCYTVHDYLHLCDQFNLINHKNEYCQIDKPQHLDPCIDCSLARFGNSNQLSNRRIIWRNVLDSSDRIFHGSRESITISKNSFYPDTSKNVILPPSCDQYNLQLKAKDENSIAIIGNFTNPKGGHFLLKIIENGTLDDFEIVLLGRVDEEFKRRLLLLKEKGKNLNVIGEYKQGSFEAIQHCSIALFGSIWPETYCLTATEAIQLGQKIVVPRIGAFVSRFEGREGCFLYEVANEASLKAAINNAQHGEVPKINELEVSSYVDRLEINYLELIRPSLGFSITPVSNEWPFPRGWFTKKIHLIDRNQVVLNLFARYIKVISYYIKQMGIVPGLIFIVKKSTRKFLLWF